MDPTAAGVDENVPAGGPRGGGLDERGRGACADVGELRRLRLRLDDGGRRRDRTDGPEDDAAGLSGGDGGDGDGDVVEHAGLLRQ